jgi:hypothetical protein
MFFVAPQRGAAFVCALHDALDMPFAPGRLSRDNAVGGPSQVVPPAVD